jgi:hypothetical protein
MLLWYFFLVLQLFQLFKTYFNNNSSGYTFYQGNTMEDISLSEELYNEVIHLTRVYYRQAEICHNNKAYLAGCIMIGAAFEAALLTFTDCFSDEVIKSELAPKKNGKIKPLESWNLSNLLAVAKERNWLPSGLSLEDEWDDASAEIGDYGEVLRQIRNFVHPIRYASDFTRKRITQRYLDSMFGIFHSTIDQLMQPIHVSLVEALKNEMDE